MFSFAFTFTPSLSYTTTYGYGPGNQSPQDLSKFLFYEAFGASVSAVARVSVEVTLFETLYMQYTGNVNIFNVVPIQVMF